MTVFGKMLLKIGKITAKLVEKKYAYFPPTRKIVSFSFDDFPITAIDNGARLLESREVRGTFYSSLGMAGTLSSSGKIATQEEMLAISGRGHECACHTFGHLDCAETSSQFLLEDCRYNQETAKGIAGVEFQSFAYPYGSFNLASKRVIGRIFDSARTTEPGINVKKIDLAALRGIALYERFGIETAKLWLSKLDETGGWMIFYTHDVTDIPSRFGCSIDHFERVLDLCLENGVQIATVAGVTEMFSAEAAKGIS